MTSIDWQGFFAAQAYHLDICAEAPLLQACIRSDSTAQAGYTVGLLLKLMASQNPTLPVALSIKSDPAKEISVEKFNPTSSHPLRALQAWQILIGAAMNRQTLTYLGLSQKMYRKNAQGVLDKILGHVAYFCIDRELPALTAIVVGKGRGTPGQDIPANLANLDEIREAVYDTDWYNVVPPSTQELKASFDSRK